MSTNIPEIRAVMLLKIKLRPASVTITESYFQETTNKDINIIK